MSGFPLFWLLAAVVVTLYLNADHFRGWFEYRHHPARKQIFWNSFKDWLISLPMVFLWCFFLWPLFLIMEIGADLERNK